MLLYTRIQSARIIHKQRASKDDKFVLPLSKKIVRGTFASHSAAGYEEIVVRSLLK